MSEHRPLVLVVEDDVAMNELQQELLSLNGFQTLGAYTGVEALALCEESSADAVLLDIMLPEMDGFETCTRLRRQKNGSLPIVMVSALAGEESRKQGFASGANAYFSKPFDPEEVMHTLRKLINNCPSA